MVPFFSFGPHANNTRMSVTTFGSSANVNFFLNDHSSAESILTAIDGITYPRGGTQTARGLDLLRSHVFVEPNGMRPVSEGIPRVVIVVTDGQAASNPAPASLALQADPVNALMISMGVGTGWVVPFKPLLASMRGRASSCVGACGCVCLLLRVFAPVKPSPPFRGLWVASICTLLRVVFPANHIWPK